MDNYIYLVETSKGKHYWYNFEEALQFYQENEGIKCEAKTKDLFPTWYTIIDEPNIDIERIRENWTMKKTSKALRNAIERYDNKTAKRYCLKFNSVTDKDLIDFLDSLDNKQGFIKEAIIEKMKKMS